MIGGERLAGRIPNVESNWPPVLASKVASGNLEGSYPRYLLLAWVHT